MIDTEVQKTWDEGECNLWQVNFYGGTHGEGPDKDHKVFVICESAEDAMEAVKEVHDRAAVIRKVKRYCFLEQK